MPERLERELRAEAMQKFPSDVKRQDAYVYGTMRKTGWRPRKQRLKRGNKNG